MNHTVATIVLALGVAVAVLGLIGLLRPRMYESMMRRPSAKGPIPQLRLVATIELVVGIGLAVFGVVAPWAA